MEEERGAGEENGSMKRVLFIINCILLSLGNCGGRLITRLYFLYGGNRVWLCSWLQTCGFPLLLIPLAICYIRRRRSQEAKPLIFMKARLFVASAIIGILTGLDNYLYASGFARLPVSTSSLIIATHLAFTAAFAFLLVKQKFTAFSVNAIVLLTIGAGVLSLHSTGDRPSGESTKQYVLGFVMTLGAAALYGFLLPLVELMYKKSKQRITYTRVLQIQFVISFSATLFCTVGMLVNNDFKVIGREAKEFELGETKYYVVVVCCAIIWQAFILGTLGVIFCASSLLSSIIIAVLLPVTEILAVIFYKENFTAKKGVVLALSIWGLVSYFYGEYKQVTPETELPPTLPNP